LYLQQPEGFVDDKNPNYVLKLNKALYGLKQSARIWQITLKEALIKLGFEVLQADNCIFINRNTNVILCVYVDDIAAIGPNTKVIDDFIKDLEKYFKIKNLGPIKDYLGIDFIRDSNSNTLKLSQSNYIQKVLDKFGLSQAKSAITPFDAKTKLEPNNTTANTDQTKLFQSIIGSLLYITLGTRPDIAFAVIKLSRFASNPSTEHITAAKRVLRYLKSTIDYSITYSNTSSYASGYCDSDYAGDLAKAKSTFGWIFYLANGPISWKSKLGSIIAQSTTEAEYIAINAAAKEAVYIKSLLQELGYYKQDRFPLYTDNNGALLLAKNPVFHERTKHIAVKFHYIRDLINKGIIDLYYISTNDQKADGLTKALEKIKFQAFLVQLGLLVPKATLEA
jgi:hypothetical protein